MIEVRIDNAAQRKDISATARGYRLLDALKKAGAPVNGVLAIEGCERGRITVFNDEMFDQTVVQWRDEGEHE